MEPADERLSPWGLVDAVLYGNCCITPPNGKRIEFAPANLDPWSVRRVERSRTWGGVSRGASGGTSPPMGRGRSECHGLQRHAGSV